MITYMGKQKFNVDRFFLYSPYYIDKYTHCVDDGARHYCGTLQRGGVVRDVSARCPLLYTQKKFALGRLHLSLTLFALLIAYYSHICIVKVFLAVSAKCLRVWLLTVLTQLVRLMINL